MEESDQASFVFSYLIQPLFGEKEENILYTYVRVGLYVLSVVVLRISSTQSYSG